MWVKRGSYEALMSEGLARFYVISLCLDLVSPLVIVVLRFAAILSTRSCCEAKEWYAEMWCADGYFINEVWLWWCDVSCAWLRGGVFELIWKGQLMRSMYFTSLAEF